MRSFYKHPLSSYKQHLSFHRSDELAMDEIFLAERIDNDNREYGQHQRGHFHILG
ncbi:hypothetical protein [Paenibacillus sp. J2TS4]|uniref:hypothetical protein n=1 Tax=Paenibacillus sp. J2TS4 TaxID=2807194 RepID=UPI001B0A28E1|nr:hypothetical protein [Paenibacillus sp. J2TS4]GIP33392.1 hypothetical protein J2TS4_26020 [Paenibacillus sp. J2TS4]